MIEWDDALKIRNSPLYLDSRLPRRLSFISHAHSDHLPHPHPHGLSITSPATAALAEHRIGPSTVQMLDYRTDWIEPESQLRLRLLPAGHVLGSAMLHITGPEGTLLYTGDFKLRDGLTVEQADPRPADVLVMESTYGLPFLRVPPWRRTADELVERTTAALRAGRQPIVMGYSLGKAQEIVRILTDAGLNVTCHGAVCAMNAVYERMGVHVGPHRRYRLADFHGPAALDLAERGALVAPPSVARTAFSTRFDRPLRIMMSGWAMLKNAQYRYGVDVVLPLSDHADFDELMELVDRVRPKRIFTHHGYKEFVESLRAQGHDAKLARPEAQLLLFE